MGNICSAKEGGEVVGPSISLASTRLIFASVCCGLFVVWIFSRLALVRVARLLSTKRMRAPALRRGEFSRVGPRITFHVLLIFGQVGVRSRILRFLLVFHCDCRRADVNTYFLSLTCGEFLIATDWCNCSGSRACVRTMSWQAFLASPFSRDLSPDWDKSGVDWV